MDEVAESLVEMTTIEEIVNMCRIITSELYELESMLNKYYDTAVDLKKLYERVREIKSSGEGNYLRVMQYLVKSSEIALYVSIYMDIVRSLERVIQLIDAVAYRILLARENSIILDKAIIETFIKIIELEKIQLQGFEEALSKLRLSSKIVLDKLQEVFKIEEDIDSIFRRSLFEVYSKYSGYITALLILKDIFEHLEEISDIIKDGGEDVRYIAMARRA